jgi:hypothetical protein
MKWANVRIRAAGATTVVTLALGATAGCSGSATTADTATARTASPSTDAVSGTPAATTTAAAATTSGPAATASPVLADGRSAVYLTGLDTTRSTVTFDLIEFLTGDAAKAEWKKEHPDNPDGPDNDYMIVNNNTKLRTLPVAADAKCVVLSTLGSTDTKTISFAALPAFLKQQNKGMTLTPPHISLLPFWLTVKHGTVTKLEEQFLP